MSKLSQVISSAGGLKFFMNLWPPYLFSGIRIEKISSDFREVQVALRERFYNRNYVGTHFGGSLFAMLDPFFMLMVMRNLDRCFYVWDRSGTIEFVKPGRGRVFSNMKIEQAHIDDILMQTASGKKYEPEFEAQIKDEAGQLVAVYRKTLYIRLKPQYRPSTSTILN